MTRVKATRWLVILTIIVATFVTIVFMQFDLPNGTIARRKFFAFKQLTSLGVTPRNQDKFDIILLYQLLKKQEPTDEELVMVSREIDKIDSLVVIFRVPDSNDHLLPSLSTFNQPPHLRKFEYYPSTFSEKELKELRFTFPAIDFSEVDNKGNLEKF